MGRACTRLHMLACLMQMRANPAKRLQALAPRVRRIGSMESMQSLMQLAPQIKTGAGSSQPLFDLDLWLLLAERFYLATGKPSWGWSPQQRRDSSWPDQF